MLMTNKQYAMAKQILTILVPGLVTLLTALGKIYGFDTQALNGTITAVATFAGLFLNVLSANYDKDQLTPPEDTKKEA